MGASEPVAVALRFGQRLDEAGLRYMIVGSVAAAIHGYIRTTQDLDIVIERAPGAVRRFVRALDEHAFYVDLDVALDAVRRGSLFNVIEFESGWKVDLIALPEGEFDREQLEAAVRVEIDGATIGVACAEATIVAKLRWAAQSGSARQLEDARRLFEIRRDDLDAKLLDRWAGLVGVRDQLDTLRQP